MLPSQKNYCKQPPTQNSTSQVAPSSQDGAKELCEFRCSHIEACTRHRPSSMHKVPKQVRDGSRAEPEPIPLKTSSASTTAQ